MIKKLILYIFTLIISQSIYCQVDKEEVKKIFEEYFTTVIQKDNEKTLEYIYPKLFDNFPKDKMLESLNKLKADTLSVTTLENGIVENISEILEIEGIKYALVKYSFKMTLKYLKNNGNKKLMEGEKYTIADFTHTMLKEKYGEKNVKYTKKTSTFEVNVSNEMYAVKDPVYKDWKFLEKKGSMKPILNKLLPKEVIDKF